MAAASEQTPLAINGSQKQYSDEPIVVGSKSAASSSNSNGSDSGVALIHLEELVAPNDTAHVISRVEKLRTTFRSGVTKPLAWRVGALKSLQACLIETQTEISEALYADLRKCAYETWLAECE